jgi:hypothetical protein
MRDDMEGYPNLSVSQKNLFYCKNQKKVLSRDEKKENGISIMFLLTLVTVLPAPMTHPFPIVTPPNTITRPPIQQSSPIVTSMA